MLSFVKVALILTLVLLLAFSAGSATAPPALAQAKFKSGIIGRVTDRNGALVVTATITLVGRTTKKPVYAKTDENGEYAVDLEPEIYDVEAEAPGFKTVKRSYIPVESQARSVVDFVMFPKED